MAIEAASYRIRTCTDCGRPVIDLVDEEDQTIASGHMAIEQIDSVIELLQNIKNDAHHFTDRHLH